MNLDDRKGVSWVEIEMRRENNELLAEKNRLAQELMYAQQLIQGLKKELQDCMRSKVI